MERGKPRFDKRERLPEVPEGMELYKFHGQPVLIPSAVGGEEMVGNSGYTKRQIDRLIELEDQRLKKAREELGILTGSVSEKSESIFSKPGVIHKRFIDENGMVEDVEDRLFEHVLLSAAIAFYPVDMSEFLLEVDMMQGRVPDSRVFSLEGEQFRLVHIPFEGWGTGNNAFVESLTGATERRTLS